MSYNLFLDDIFTPPQIADLTNISVKDKDRYRKYNWKIVSTFEDFVKIIKEKGLPDIVSFDHDLDEEHWDFLYDDFVDYDKFNVKTGYHAAEWLIEYCANKQINLPICLVHSQNSIGRKNINNLLF